VYNQSLIGKSRHVRWREKMEHRIRISGYDVIKLVFLLVVIAFVVGIIRFTPIGTPVAQNNLPPLPPANFTWRYDSNAGELSNRQGVQLYRLSSDGKVWQPVIPAGLLLQLPARFNLRQNSAGGWQIFDVNGAVVSSWNTDSFTWVIGLIPTPTPTRVITSPTLTPTLPLATLSPTLKPTIQVTPTATVGPTQIACNSKTVSRLTVGQPAVILINLNLHTQPEMTDNIFNATPAGETVEVLQGPLCVPYQDSAYLWWQIRNPKGVVGWSVEATLNGSVYFLGPKE